MCTLYVKPKYSKTLEINFFLNIDGSQHAETAGKTIAQISSKESTGAPSSQGMHYIINYIKVKLIINCYYVHTLH